MMLRRLAVAASIAFCFNGSADTAHRTPAKKGTAALKAGGQSLSFDKIDASSFSEGPGHRVAKLRYQDANRQWFILAFLYDGPGPVAPDKILAVTVIQFQGGTQKLTSFQPGKSSCALVLTKATETAVEGNGDCKLIHDPMGKPAEPLTGIKFAASAD